MNPTPLLRQRPPGSNQLFFIIEPEKIRDIIKVLRVRLDTVWFAAVPKLWDWMPVSNEKPRHFAKDLTLTVPSSSPVATVHGVKHLTRLIAQLHQA